MSCMSWVVRMTVRIGLAAGEFQGSTDAGVDGLDLVKPAEMRGPYGRGGRARVGCDDEAVGKQPPLRRVLVTRLGRRASAYSRTVCSR